MFLRQNKHLSLNCEGHSGHKSGLYEYQPNNTLIVIVLLLIIAGDNLF